MRRSLILLPRGVHGTRETLTAVGQAADQAGLARVWFGDHLVYPVEIRSTYPGAGGPLGFNPATPQLDLAMTIVALASERLGIGTSVVVLAQRSPVAFPKQLASLDVVSRGRLALGIGVAGARRRSRRWAGPSRAAARTDQYVAAMRALWTEPEPTFDGDFARFAPVYCTSGFLVARFSRLAHIHRLQA